MQPHHLNLLSQHATRLSQQRTSDLFTIDPTRFEKLSLRVGSLFFDFSKQKIDAPAVAALLEIAKSSEIRTAADAMFRGEKMNVSEQRAALHTALRAEECSLAPAAIQNEINQTLRRMETLVHALYEDRPETAELPAGITDIVNVGIGGSDLGPRLAVNALQDFRNKKFSFHFLPNVDGNETAKLMRQLDPKRTLILLISKSFTTQETLLNGTVLKHWIEQSYGENSIAATKHFVAVTANTMAAQTFGVLPEHILPMWDWVGGRYSVWSAVGLVVALAIGMPRFREFLAGARAMDFHFRTASPPQNMPTLLAMTGIWNRNALQYPTLAVIPYDDRLQELPAYLQQLEMESLGKSISPNGEDVTEATVPVIWGNVGTNAQHAFFQALHQGTDIIPVDFIGVIKPAHDLKQNHQALLANMLAQSAALMKGKSTDHVMSALCNSGIAEDHQHRLARQKTFMGDRPSSILLIDELTPHSLGELLALYEHKVFVQSQIWEINAFDQWGVELGKQIAKQILSSLEKEAIDEDFDSSTYGILELIRQKL